MVGGAEVRGERRRVDGVVPTARGEEEEAKGDLQEAGHRGGEDCPDGVAASSADPVGRWR